MNISITGRHLDITPSLKQYIQKKVEKVKYYFEHIINVYLILEVNKLSHSAEVTIHSDEKTFFCEVISGDMYESVDKVFAKVERQIRRNKEKISDRKSKGISKSFGHANTIEESKINITKIKEISPKPKSRHEALLQLSLNNHKFDIFKEDSGIIKESIALKNENNCYSLIQQSNGQWIEHIIKLENNNIVEESTKEYNVEYITLAIAIDRLFKNNLRYIIYHDSEYNSLNILYFRKNKTLGLLTSGGIDES